MRTVIPIENNDTLSGLRRFLKQLLEAGVVDALLLPMETPAGAITPALVADPDLVDSANPLAPVMGLNAARVAGNVSVREPRGRVGVVLRPCELRALVELVKLQQASLDDLVTIGMDCTGTYDVPDYVARDQGSGIRTWHELYEGLVTAPESPVPALRDACQMCERAHVEPGMADIVLEFLGADLTAGIPVSLPDEVGEKLELSPSETDGKRDQVIEKVVASRTQARDARFAEIRQQIEQEGMEGVFAACVRCHNCMTVCPICYCKTCLFKSPVFDHEPAQYMSWARRKGAYRLPADTMLFHLTRLNHMVLSCIGCGMCTSGCPSDLPVGAVFRVIGQQVQEVFDYVPGRSVDEPLPLVTFREDEWMDVGEE
jgi:formate dehydrogenase subunit beta